jgi:hypothetical protein
VVRKRSLVSLAASAGFVLAIFALGAGDTRPVSPSAPAVTSKAKPSSKAQNVPAASATDAAAQGKAPLEPNERRPYKIRAWFRVDPSARIDDRGRDRLVASWRSLVSRFVGPPWVVDVADGEGPLATETLEGLLPSQLAPLAAGYDKLWMIRIEPAANSMAFVGREYDVLTTRLGPACRRAAPYPADAPRALLALALNLFEPTAEIGAKVGGGVQVTVRGAGLPAASPAGRVVTVGSVFRPLRIWQKPDGSVRKIDDITRSFLRVTELNGAAAVCDIVTSKQDPLSARAASKNSLVALGVKPGSIATRFRYYYLDEKAQIPLAGYTLTARTVPDGPQIEVGMTDREGRVSVPSGFAEGLVIFRLLAANIEPIDEFPAMPGETLEEQPVHIFAPKPATVALETQLNSLRDELIDLVATRARLDSRLDARAKGEKWDEVEELLEEYRKLTPRSDYVDRLAKLKDDAARQQAETKTAILTRTAQAMITETQALIDRYLDDETYKAYADALAQYKAQSGKAQPKQVQIKGRPAPATPPPVATTARPTTPPAGSAPPVSAPPVSAPPVSASTPISAPDPAPAQPAPTPAKRAPRPAAPGVVPF